jgi:hypothetical protein
VSAARNKSRSSPRLRRRCKIALSEAQGKAGASAAAAFTVDVSAGGFCAELMRVPPPGTQVTGSIAIGGQEYPFSGRIAWTRASAPHMNLRGRIGVTFSEIADEFKKKLT